MIPGEETFDGTWPFAARFHGVPAAGGAAAFRMHYVDEGPPRGEAIVCLHGEPTWGYLYRRLIPPLAERWRVLVPDHMGFGKSATGFENTAAADDTWVRAYSAPFETPEECAGAVEFPKDAYLGRIRDYVREGAAGIDALRAKPAMLAEGLRDHAIPPALAIADFEGLWPTRPVVRLPGAGHFCQEDVPDTLVALVSQFMQST
jgi:pimeloyl-ACP methyl ester carboxylesterase